MSGANDLFGSSYRLSIMNPRSQALSRSLAPPQPTPAPLREYEAYSSMSSSPSVLPRPIYDAYGDSSSSSTTVQPLASSQPAVVRERSRSPAPRVHFADVPSYVSPSPPVRRSIKRSTDPPKVHQLYMNTTYVEDVEDSQWATASTTPKIESTLNVGGIEWVFKVQKRALEGASHVGFTLVCGAKLRSALWRMTANVKLIIRKKDGDKFVERTYPNNEFTFASKTLADMIPWAELETTLGCKDDSKSLTLSFELQIEISKSYGFRRRARFEYSFFEPSVETDMVLTVENKELYVNATYLSMLSPFFRSLHTSKNVALYGEIPTETISDVSLDDFLQLLHVVYPSERPVTVENVELLLKLADRYSFESVLVKCENFLVTPAADEIDVFTRLEWASKYAMADLQDHCVSKLTNAQAVGAVKKTLLYGTLSHETRKLLLELMLKFSNM